VKNPDSTHRRCLSDLPFFFDSPCFLSIHYLGMKAEAMQQIPAAMSPQENIG